MDLKIYFGNADFGLKFERDESVGRHLDMLIQTMLEI